MTGQHFLSAAGTDVFGPLHGGERMMWRGRCGVAEYAFEEAASLPLWTLPETTDVLVTDQRVVYAYAAGGDVPQVRSGELRWLWPQHLRVQPGARSTDRGAAATQVQVVCAGADGSWPALVFAGGDLRSVTEADHLANTMRQAIARFRVDHAGKLGLTTPQARMLSRLLMSPEFRNHQGGSGQTVSLLGALPVHRPAAPEPGPAAEVPQRVVGEDGTRQIKYRPGLAADAARAIMAAQAEQTAYETEPERASRAAELAARVADFVSRSADGPGDEPGGAPGDEPVVAQAPVAGTEPVGDLPTVNFAERAKAVRRTGARMAANAARNRGPVRRSGQDSGVGGKHRS
jgi:hypothetical protein